MSVLNPRQFFSRQPLAVQVSEGAPAPKQVSYASKDPRSDEQKVLDQEQFDQRGLPSPPSYTPRHRA